jgi:starch-binding outer membrane protein SusE/F
MKNRVKLLILIISIVLIHSCKEEVAPTVITSDVTNISGTAATCGGTITDEGSGEIVFRGVCWSTTSIPTNLDNNTYDGDSIGTFISNMTDLMGATTYYVRAYATNVTAGYGNSTGYGNTITFTTLGQLPIAETYPATNIAKTSATLNATVKANYLSTTVIFEYGPTESYGQTVTAAQSPVTGNDFINISSDIKALAQSSVYHFRIHAFNSLGTTNGSDMIFSTTP